MRSGLQPVDPVDKSDVYFELTSLTLEFLTHAVRDNQSTALHQSQRQMYSVFGSFFLVPSGEIHISVPTLCEF